MSDIHLSGFLFNASGAAVSGATVEAFAKNTVTETGGTPVTGGSTTTNSSGYYSMTVTSDNELDVRITSGNSVRWRRFDDRLQIEEVEVSVLNIREGATAQVYTIAPGSICADRTLTLPAATGDDTLASLGMAQTFSANQAFTGTVTVGTDGSGTDVIFYSGTAGDNLTWDASEELLTITGTNGTTALNVADGNVTIADNLTVSGNLTVTGTTTSVDSTTINAATAFVFEGATADAHETTLGIVDPTADATINLPAMSAGTYYLPVMSAASTTAVSSTPAELNLLDGSSANTVVNSKAVIYGSGGEVAGTLSTAAQTSVTSLGTLTALTVDDVAVNGKVVTMTGSACDTVVMTAAANGAFSLVTTDTAAAAANIQITADGTVDIDSAGVLTLDSGAAINIEPASGSAILLDGTISIDAGVVTGATSITSTAFVGALSTAAQTNITSLGTLTALTVDDVAVDGKVVTMTGSACDTIVMTAAANGAFSLVTTDAAAAAANIQITADGTVDIDSAGVLTLDSGAAINIEPASGSAVLIDGTVSIDGAAITGATSILATDIKIGEDDETKVDFADANIINLHANNIKALSVHNTSSKGEMRFYEGCNYVGFAAPALSADQVWALPTADGSCGQVLSTDGSGALSWASAGGVTGTGGTDNAILRANGTGGSSLQNSNVTINDSNQVLHSDGSNTAPSIAFSSDSTKGFFHVGSNVMGWSTGSANTLHQWNGSGAVFTKDCANSKLTVGYTVNQACNDNEIFALKSTDVGHGITDWAETDTYLSFKKQSVSQGGTQMNSFHEGTNALIIRGAVTTEVTSKTNTSGAPVEITASLKGSGGCAATLVDLSTSDANLMTISNNGNPIKFIFDIEGTMHGDLATAIFDDECDVELLRGFLATTCDQYKDNYINKFGQDLMYNQQWYEDNKFIGKCSIHYETRKCGRVEQRAMVNVTGLTMLHHSTIIQLADRVNARLDGIENQLKALTEGK